MNRIFLLLVAVCAGCGEALEAHCGDADYWSENVAVWPVEEVYVGEAALALHDAIDLLELPAEDGRDALSKALVVAELNLAAGAPETGIGAVYDGHAWLSSDDGRSDVDDEAVRLARAIESASVCL